MSNKLLVNVVVMCVNFVVYSVDFYFIDFVGLG